MVSSRVIGNLASTPSLNRYAYANGNPVTQIDPFGLSAEPGTKKAKKNINWREAVHDALDIAGSITGYGDICDAVNAVLYLTEGDYINAGRSALSIIPGADAFTKTGKASKVLGNGIVESGLKHLDYVADGIKKLVKKADDAIDLEKHLPKKLLTEEAETFAKKADKVADDVVEDAAKAIKGSTGSDLDGVRIINKKYAGKTFELSGDLGKKYPKGVNFSNEGFPKFESYSIKKVTINNLEGDAYYDFIKANEVAGYSSTPTGYTWHHVEDGKTMLLVPSDLHGAVRHTGGASLIRKGIRP